MQVDQPRFAPPPQERHNQPPNKSPIGRLNIFKKNHTPTGGPAAAAMASPAPAPAMTAMNITAPAAATLSDPPPMDTGKLQSEIQALRLEKETWNSWKQAIGEQAKADQKSLSEAANRVKELEAQLKAKQAAKRMSMAVVAGEVYEEADPSSPPTPQRKMSSKGGFNALRKLTKKSKSLDVQSNGSVMREEKEKLALLEKQEAEIKEKLAREEQRARELQAEVERLSREKAAPEPAPANDSRVSELEAQVNMLKAQLEQQKKSPTRKMSSVSAPPPPPAPPGPGDMGGGPAPPPPPPPAPGPPPPPGVPSAAESRPKPPGGGGMSAGLLGAIQQGKSLKKVVKPVEKTPAQRAEAAKAAKPTNPMMAQIMNVKLKKRS